MKHVYMLLFAVALTLSAAAQTNYKPGYIQKADGSVQQGLLDYRSETRLGQKLTFKLNEGAQEIVYKPGQLQGYGFEGSKRYETHTVTGADSVQQLYFLEVLVKGSADLFFAKQDDTERFFIRKGEQPLMELVLEKRRVEKEGKVYFQDVKLYIGTLTYLFSDCKEVTQLLERTNFQQSELTKITTKYNLCMVPGEENFTKDVNRKLMVDIALVAGVGAAKAIFSAVHDEYPYLTGGNHTAALSPSLGIGIDIRSYKLSEKLNLSTGFLLSTYKLEGEYTRNASAQVYSRYSYSLKAFYIKMPFMLRYIYPKGALRPFANLGVQQGILISADSKVTEHATFYESKRVSEGDALGSVRKYEFGFVGGFGAMTDFTKKTNLSIEVRFEKNNGLSPYIYLRQENYISSLQVALVF